MAMSDWWAGLGRIAGSVMGGFASAMADDVGAMFKGRRRHESRPPRGHDPRPALAGAIPGMWASNHQAEARQCSGWQFVAVRRLAKMCSRAVLHVEESDDRAANRRGVRRSLRLARRVGDRKSAGRWNRWLKRNATGGPGKAGGTSQDRPVPRSHPLRELLTRCNPEWSGVTFVFAAAQQLAITGTALVWCVRNELGAPAELYVLPTGLCTPQRPSAEYPEGAYRLAPIGAWGVGSADGVWGMGSLGAALMTGARIDARDVKPIRDPHPLYLADGLSPLAAGALWVDVAQEMDRSNFSLMRNAPRPALVFSLEDDADPDQTELARFDEWLRQDASGGENAGKNLRLPRGVKAEPRSTTPLEMDYASARKDYRDANMALHGMAPITAGITEAGSYSAFWAAIKQTNELAVQPLLDLIAGELTELLGDEWDGPRCVVRYESRKIDDPQLAKQWLEEARSAGNAVTVDEYRAKLNGQDVKLRPLGGELGKQFVGVRTTAKLEDGEPEEPGTQNGGKATGGGGLEAMLGGKKDGGDKAAPATTQGGTGVRQEGKDAQPGRRVVPAMKSHGKGDGEKPEPHRYATIHVALPPDLAGSLLSIGRTVPDEVLAESGREDDPHITAMYGLHGDSPEAVAAVVAAHGPFRVQFGALSLFPASEGRDFDVLKVGVISDGLVSLHGAIAEALPHTDTHPMYSPHATIAYLAAGEGRAMLALPNPLAGKPFLVREIVFSSRDGTRTVLPLGDGAVRKSADWDEGKHPRAEDGKFGSGGGSGEGGGGKDDGERLLRKPQAIGALMKPPLVQ